MKQRPKAVLALIASVTLIGIMVPFLGARSYVITREQYDLIKVGMTQAELEVILGGPPKNCLKSQAVVCVPRAADEKVVSAFIRRGTPTEWFFANHNTSFDGHQVVWISRSGLIAAYFAQDGRMKKKYFSTVHESGGPSIFSMF